MRGSCATGDCTRFGQRALMVCSIDLTSVLEKYTIRTYARGAVKSAFHGMKWYLLLHFRAFSTRDTLILTSESRRCVPSRDSNATARAPLDRTTAHSSSTNLFAILPKNGSS